MSVCPKNVRVSECPCVRIFGKLSKVQEHKWAPEGRYCSESLLTPPKKCIFQVLQISIWHFDTIFTNQNFPRCQIHQNKLESMRLETREHRTIDFRRNRYHMLGNRRFGEGKAFHFTNRWRHLQRSETASLQKRLRRQTKFLRTNIKRKIIRQKLLKSC